MSRPILIYDPKAGGDVEARLDFAPDGLTVFDLRGRKLRHWPYQEIIDAAKAGDGPGVLLAHVARPEIRLRIRDNRVYEAVRVRAPQLRAFRPGWRGFSQIMAGMPEEAMFGLILLAGAIAFAIYGFVTDLFK